MNKYIVKNRQMVNVFNMTDKWCKHYHRNNLQRLNIKNITPKTHSEKMEIKVSY